MHRLSRVLGFALAAALLLPPAAGWAEVKTVHASLKSAKAQANREQIFKLLMTGQTPDWLRGKSSAEIGRRKEAVRKAVLAQGRKVVKAIAANPTGKAVKAEQTILGLLSPAQRAQLLKDEAGFKVERITSTVNGQTEEKFKVTLKRFAGGDQAYYWQTSPEYEKQMSIYNRVMAPNIITYMPAGYHSKYVSRGEVFDIWGSDYDNGYGTLRPNEFALYPTWLSDGEATRMAQVIRAGRKNWETALGTQMSHGRPAMWPPVEGGKGKTGNSCTTTFIRAPIGERQSRYAWIDELQAKVMKAAGAGRAEVQGIDLKKDTVLAAVTGKSKAQYEAIFASLARQLPQERAAIDRLKGQVDFFYEKLKYRDAWSNQTREQCNFPMDLMHRAPLAELARVTGDPVGPKGASKKFRAGDPTRLGAVTVFEKPPR